MRVRLLMATCPECGARSRDDETAFVVEPVLVAKPLGTYSVAGAQMKASAYERLRLRCRCGWSILGHIDGDQFVSEGNGDERT